MNAYAVQLTYGDLVRVYIFGLEGYWTLMEGSRVGEIVEVGEVTTSDVAAGVISGSSLGVTFDELYCNPYPDDNPFGCDDDATRLAILQTLKRSGAISNVKQPIKIPRQRLALGSRRDFLPN